jgi:hypothetical protein
LGHVGEFSCSGAEGSNRLIESLVHGLAFNVGEVRPVFVETKGVYKGSSDVGLGLSMGEVDKDELGGEGMEWDARGFDGRGKGGPPREYGVCGEYELVFGEGSIKGMEMGQIVVNGGCKGGVVLLAGVFDIL